MARQVQEFTDKIEEQLTKVGAGTERIQVWAQLESKLMVSVRWAQDVRPQHTRGQMIKYVAHLAKAFQLPNETVFTATTLLDLAFLRVGHAGAGAQLPELVFAMVRMLHKMDNTSWTIQCADFMQQTSDAAEQLCSQGEVNNKGDITMEDLVKAEATLASTLQWQFDVPSMQQWLQLYVTRLAQIYPITTEHLKWVYQKAIGFAELIVFKHITYKDILPQEVAQGLFCTGLVVAGIVPVVSLCPSGGNTSSWEAHWQNCLMWPGMPLPSTPSLIHAEIGACLLQLLTETPISVLQYATVRSVHLVWNSVPDLHFSSV